MIFDVAGHHVAIVGGGDSAFDWIWALRPLARSFTIVYRRDRFRATDPTDRTCGPRRQTGTHQRPMTG